MSIEAIVKDLLLEIDRIVDKKVEEKLPEMVRALGIREAEPQTESLVDAVEIAKILGRDVSTPESVRRARKHVYNLARINSIPSVRTSPRRIMFDAQAVKRKLAQSSDAQAA